MQQSFVIIMTICGNHQHDDFLIKDSVNHPMLLGDFPTPSSFWLSFQRLWMPRSCHGVLCQFRNKALSLIIGFGFTFCEFSQVVLCLIFDANPICHGLVVSRMLSNPLQEASPHIRLVHRLPLRGQAWHRTLPSSSAWGLPFPLLALQHTWQAFSSEARCQQWHLYPAKFADSLRSIVLLSYVPFFLFTTAKLHKYSETTN